MFKSADFLAAIDDYARLVLMYVQQLHEASEAKAIALTLHKYDFLEGESGASLVDQWTLKQRQAGVGSIESQLGLNGGSFARQATELRSRLEEMRGQRLFVSFHAPVDGSFLRVIVEFNMHLRSGNGYDSFVPIGGFTDVTRAFLSPEDVELWAVLAKNLPSSEKVYAYGQNLFTK